MKKKIALLGAIGVAGGLLYALESRRRNQVGSKEDASADSADNRSAANAGERGDGQASSTMQNQKAESTVGKQDHPLDDRGTGQSEASQILKSIRDHAFEASDEKLALALGRPTEEIEQWTSGHGLIDGEVVMKARTLAMQRGFEI